MADTDVAEVGVGVAVESAAALSDAVVSAETGVFFDVAGAAPAMDSASGLGGSAVAEAVASGAVARPWAGVEEPFAGWPSDLPDEPEASDEAERFGAAEGSDETEGWSAPVAVAVSEPLDDVAVASEGATEVAGSVCATTEADPPATADSTVPDSTVPDSTGADSTDPGSTPADSPGAGSAAGLSCGAAVSSSTVETPSAPGLTGALSSAWWASSLSACAVTPAWYSARRRRSSLISRCWSRQRWKPAVTLHRPRTHVAAAPIPIRKNVDVVPSIWMLRTSIEVSRSPPTAMPVVTVAAIRMRTIPMAIMR